jgi:hypothetical protein
MTTIIEKRKIETALRNQEKKEQLVSEVELSKVTKMVRNLKTELI